MRLLKRLMFAIKHDILPEYIVVPMGDEFYNPVRFIYYQDAVAFAEKEGRTKPQYGRPGVLIMLEDTK